MKANDIKGKLQELREARKEFEAMPAIKRSWRPGRELLVKILILTREVKEFEAAIKQSIDEYRK